MMASGNNKTWDFNLEGKPKATKHNVDLCRLKSTSKCVFRVIILCKHWILFNQNLRVRLHVKPTRHASLSLRILWKVCQTQLNFYAFHSYYLRLDLREVQFLPSVFSSAFCLKLNIIKKSLQISDYSKKVPALRDI